MWSSEVCSSDLFFLFVFFFNDTATTEIYTLSLHDALPIFGMGVTYYAALYYAMAVGRAEVNAGGTHEAFIGGGYAMGPLIGLATFQVSNQGSTTSYQSLVIVVLILIALALLGLGFYWRKAR